MSFINKNTSAVSEAIFKEQRQLRKERLLASPGLIIGNYFDSGGVGPVYQQDRPECYGCGGQTETA